MVNKINELRKVLLNALECDGASLITQTIKAIQTVLDCDMCTLWSINTNNTDERLGVFVSASLLERCLKEGLDYPFSDRSDYVHPLKDSFIKEVLDSTKKTGKNYLVCRRDDDICKTHKTFEALRKMGLNHFISIPIMKDNEYVAFLKLAYKNEPLILKTEDINEIIGVINQAIISAMSRHLNYQKQQLLDDLIKNYEKKKISNLKDIFHPIIHNILKKYFKYEGSSVFIWDSMDNRYNFLVSTGLLNVDPKKEEVFYEKGEGITGTTAQENKAMIYDDLIGLERKNDPRYLHKYRELTYNEGETMLAVPIVRSTNSNEVFGIIRFTNKINTLSQHNNRPELDYFNDTDVELIGNASHYLALYIENYLAEEERRNFISKMSHEYKTPANAIRVTIDRIQRLRNDERFMRWDFDNYLQDLINFSELQLMQVNANLFLTKRIVKENFHRILNIDHYSIKDIVKESIKIVRPIARDYRVTFDNIRIENDFPNIQINVDKKVFIIIFYNLLTNAIKYASKEKLFGVKINAEQTADSLNIYVSDNGIGVNSEDIEKIFLLGVRSDNARTINADGYGIGLYVVRYLLEIFDGEIIVTHNVSPTTFKIKLLNKLIF